MAAKTCSIPAVESAITGAFQLMFDQRQAVADVCAADIDQARLAPFQHEPALTPGAPAGAAEVMRVVHVVTDRREVQRPVDAAPGQIQGAVHARAANVEHCGLYAVKITSPAEVRAAVAPGTSVSADMRAEVERTLDDGMAEI